MGFGAISGQTICVNWDVGVNKKRVKTFVFGEAKGVVEMCGEIADGFLISIKFAGNNV